MFQFLKKELVQKCLPVVQVHHFIFHLIKTILVLIAVRKSPKTIVFWEIIIYLPNLIFLNHNNKCIKKV